MKAARVTRLDPKAPLIDNAARILRARVSELRSFIPAALDRNNETAQHDLRIAAKRLRYLLELTEFCFGDEAERARRRAREVQEVLGDLRDCDVMAPRISEHFERLQNEDALAVRRDAGGALAPEPALAAGAANRDTYRGLEVLAVHIEARRGLLFDRFVELWSELEAEGTWEALESAIEARLLAARRRRKARRRADRAAVGLAEAEEAERRAVERARVAAEKLAEARSDSRLQ